MDIPLITSTVLRGAAPVNPVTTARTAALEQLADFGMPPLASSTVDLSAPGRFLSLATLFQKKTLDLQAALADDALAQLLLAETATAALETAGAFNELQAQAIATTGLPAGTLAGQSGQSGQAPPSAQSSFLRQFGGNARDAQTSLTAVGLRFAVVPATAGDAPAIAAEDTSRIAAAAPGNAAPASLTLDTLVLREAFSRDPAATAMLLGKAADTLFELLAPRSAAALAGLAGAANPAAAAPASNPAITAYAGGERIGDVFTPAAPLAVPKPPQADATAGEQDALPASGADLLFVQNLVTDATREANAVRQNAAIASRNAGNIGQQARLMAQQLEQQQSQVHQREAHQLKYRQLGMAAGLSGASGPGNAGQLAPNALVVPLQDAVTGGAFAQQFDVDVAEQLRQSGGQAGEELRSAQAQQQQQQATQEASQQASQERLPSAAEQALQAARDPAIAAAIAGYNAGTGAFAALNAKPDIPPPKARPVAPVAAVGKVAAAEAISTSQQGGPQRR